MNDINPIESLPSPRSSERPQQFVVKTVGRSCIQAIDTDNVQELYDCFKNMSLDQVVSADFAGYTWNPWVYNYLGDTMLHISARQQKSLSISLLFFAGADTTMANCTGETADDICRSVCNNKSLAQVAYSHLNDLIHRLRPDQLVSLSAVARDKVPELVMATRVIQRIKSKK